MDAMRGISFARHEVRYTGASNTISRISTNQQVRLGGHFVEPCYNWTTAARIAHDPQCRCRKIIYALRIFHGSSERYTPLQRREGYHCCKAKATCSNSDQIQEGEPLIHRTTNKNARPTPAPTLQSRKQPRFKGDWRVCIRGM